MDINDLVKVTARAWSLQVLALMHEGVPGRQASLIAASGAGRTAFGHSLRHLLELGLLERNPGHGHPLRPEFRLTPKGIEVAAVATKIMQTVVGPDDGALLRRMWTIPILATIQRPRYFSEIKIALAPITDRALSQSLQQLQTRTWVARQIDLGMRPPRPRYQVVNLGAQIGAVVHQNLGVVDP